jgi:hypothetical protein
MFGDGHTPSSSDLPRPEPPTREGSVKIALEKAREITISGEAPAANTREWSIWAKIPARTLAVTIRLYRDKRGYNTFKATELDTPEGYFRSANFHAVLDEAVKCLDRQLRKPGLPAVEASEHISRGRRLLLENLEGIAKRNGVSPQDVLDQVTHFYKSVSN